MEVLTEEITTELDAFDIYSLFKNDKTVTFLDIGMEAENLGRYSFLGLNPFTTFKYEINIYYINDKEYFSKPFKELRKLIDTYKVYITNLKSLNYLENILEHEKCINEGYNELLFFNTEDKLTEESISNIFFIKNKKIYTPAKECGLLEGTVRKFIINNFDVIEGRFSRKDLISADSIFLTNSLMGVMRVSSIYDKSFNGCSIIETIQSVYEKQSAN